MVRFKTIKFKHYRQAREIQDRIDKGKATDEEIVLFALSLVAEWDFKDGDTGEPLELDELDELSMVQIKEVNDLFERQMGVAAEVPKENGDPSSST